MKPSQQLELIFLKQEFPYLSSLKLDLTDSQELNFFLKIKEERLSQKFRPVKDPEASFRKYLLDKIDDFVRFARLA